MNEQLKPEKELLREIDSTLEELFERHDSNFSRCDSSASQIFLDCPEILTSYALFTCQFHYDVVTEPCLKEKRYVLSSECEVNELHHLVKDLATAFLSGNESTTSTSQNKCPPELNLPQNRKKGSQLTHKRLIHAVVINALWHFLPSPDLLSQVIVFFFKKKWNFINQFYWIYLILYLLIVMWINSNIEMLHLSLISVVWKFGHFCSSSCKFSKKKRINYGNALTFVSNTKDEVNVIYFCF